MIPTNIFMASLLRRNPFICSENGIFRFQNQNFKSNSNSFLEIWSFFLKLRANNYQNMIAYLQKLYPRKNKNNGSFK